MLGYNVYRRALEDSFHLEYIKEELYKICNSDEEDFSLYEKKKTVLQEENRMTEEEKQRICGRWKAGKEPVCPEMKNRKNLQRTHRSGKQTKYGSQWLDLAQHWCFFWELRQEWPAEIYSKNKQRNFSSGNSCSNDTGDAELYSDQKSRWKKEKTGYAGA